MNQTLQPLPGTTIDPRYPDSFRGSMGETDFHTLATIWLREGLEDHFAQRNVYVASSIVFYYKEGNVTKRKDPDILVAKRAGKHLRRYYRLWEEKVVPNVFWEVASRRTWRNDLKKKRLVYARLQIKEYFLFDPEGRFLNPRLQGFRTLKGESVPIKPNRDGSLTSRELGLRLVPEGLMVRFIDVKSGKPILTRQERAEQAEEIQTKKLILRLGSERFGPPTEDVEAVLAAITDLEQLEDIAARLLSVQNWRELLASP